MAILISGAVLRKNAGDLARVVPRGRHSITRKLTDSSDAALTEEYMADKFRALLVTKDGDRQSVAATELTDADLMEGDVTVAVEHSTVNYKDGLAICLLYTSPSPRDRS